MLWAIDVGNTHTVIGLHDGGQWHRPYRLSTAQISTEDDLAGSLEPLFRLDGHEFAADEVVAASVVPRVNEVISRFAERWLNRSVRFLISGDQVGLPVSYNPPQAVGADRIANAVGALASYAPAVIVVDFGTATTFDTIDQTGTYVGGSILPGLLVSLEGLVQHTAKLPQIALVAPQAAIGKSTVESLESGLIIGYAGAVDAIAHRIRGELGGEARVIATGGLGELFVGLCETLESYEANLTLEGLRLSSAKLRS